MRPLKNDTFLRALRCQPTPYTPIWLMRQAGRYLPEYNATRKRAGSFLDLAKTPSYATEVTLQPLDRFALDAAILFSDILTIPDAMGLGLHFIDGEGPKFAHPLRDEATITALRAPSMDSLRYVYDAVAEIHTALDRRVPLIGFAGSPFTLACYMVEGGASSDFRTIKTMLYSRPDLLHHILATNATAVEAYLNAQIDAGAEAVMIFDTWGGTLGDGAYQQFSLKYMRDIVDGVKRAHPDVPLIVFTKGGGLWLEEIAAIGTDAVGLDWTVNLRKARQRVGPRCALQGNLDPMVLFSTDEAVRAAVAGVFSALAPAGSGESLDGHVFNLGHGISQFTDPSIVTTLVAAVHEMSAHRRA